MIWQGSLFEWAKEMVKEDPPDWAHYAERHEEAHNHQIMVRYPSGKVVPWRLGMGAEG